MQKRPRTFGLAAMSIGTGAGFLCLALIAVALDLSTTGIIFAATATTISILPVLLTEKSKPCTRGQKA